LHGAPSLDPCQNPTQNPSPTPLGGYPLSPDNGSLSA
jgi:hypothetical protein